MWSSQSKGTGRSFKASKRIGNIMPEVLDIDDQITVLSFLRNVLIHFGYEMKIAHDGKDSSEQGGSGTSPN